MKEITLGNGGHGVAVAVAVVHVIEKGSQSVGVCRLV